MQPTSQPSAGRKRWWIAGIAAVGAAITLPLFSSQVLADDDHDRHKNRDLTKRHPQRLPQRCLCDSGSSLISTFYSRSCFHRQRRDQHQRQNHGQIFNDQPTDSDTPVIGLRQVVFFQRS